MDFRVSTPPTGCFRASLPAARRPVRTPYLGHLQGLLLLLAPLQPEPPGRPSGHGDADEVPGAHGPGSAGQQAGRGRRAGCAPGSAGGGSARQDPAGAELRSGRGANGPVVAPRRPAPSCVTLRPRSAQPTVGRGEGGRDTGPIWGKMRREQKFPSAEG